VFVEVDTNKFGEVGISKTNEAIPKPFTSILSKP